MAFRTFRTWLIQEGKDIFGFERDRHPQKDPKNPDDGPLNSFNIERMINLLADHSIGELEPKIKYVNEVHWGEGDGAIRIIAHTDLHVEIARMGVTNTGDPTWATKKLFLINRTGFGGYEESVAEQLLDQIKYVHEGEHDSPKKISEKEMARLVSRLASKMRVTARDIFIFEGIRRVNDFDYIIRFSVRGQGIEAPDQRRVEENQTRFFYMPEQGIYRLINYNIESPVGGAHEWTIMPNDTDVKFFPTQSHDEIAEVIATTMRWY